MSIGEWWVCCWGFGLHNLRFNIALNSIAYYGENLGYKWSIILDKVNFMVGCDCMLVCVVSLFESVALPNCVFGAIYSFSVRLLGIWSEVFGGRDYGDLAVQKGRNGVGGLLFWYEEKLVRECLQNSAAELSVWEFCFSDAYNLQMLDEGIWPFLILNQAGASVFCFWFWLECMPW